MGLRSMGVKIADCTKYGIIKASKSLRCPRAGYKYLGLGTTPLFEVGFFRTENFTQILHRAGDGLYNSFVS